MAKRASIGKRIAIWSLIIIVSLIAIVIIGFGMYMRFAYGSFYAQAEDEFTIPGINDGFVCQDLDYCEKGDTWFFSGYSVKEEEAPIYRMDAKGRSISFHVKLPDGTMYTDHGSGITTSDKFAFLACERGYLVFKLDDFLNAKNGESVQAIGTVVLDFAPAFLNIENGVLYAGTFHRIPNYPAPPEHHLTTPSGKENAGIMLAFEPNDARPYGFSPNPSTAYSLPDLVQGVCVLPNGNVTLSMSWGIDSSHLNTYEISKGAAPDMFQVGERSIPLYYLDESNLADSIVAPPMTEGIEYHDGRIYISEESASDKYIFGKLYGAGQVYSISA